MTDEIRARFLGAIAKQVDAERVIEVHLFPGIRQGGVESGVAVLALERAVPLLPPSGQSADSPEAEPDVIQAEPVSAVASRYTVYSARYRLTLKGVDRGKWEVSVTEEADAPLVTIDAVVRGVQRRSGDADDAQRLSGDEFRACLPVPMAHAT